MPIRLFSFRKIGCFFRTIHSFGYYRGYDCKSDDYIAFSQLSKKQQMRIIKTNLHIFKNPEKYSYKDFKELKLIYLGENLLE
jgi:hypothetical protein